MFSVKNTLILRKKLQDRKEDFDHMKNNIAISH